MQLSTGQFRCNGFESVPIDDKTKRERGKRLSLSVLVPVTGHDLHYLPT